MGLFSRKKTGETSRSSSQSARSSEAQAAELRGRARRRLIGALVLVLTAVIVVPMLFDDPESVQPETPVVLPAVIPPVAQQPDIAALTQPDSTGDFSEHPQGDIGHGEVEEVTAQPDTDSPVTASVPPATESTPAEPEPRREQRSEPASTSETPRADPPAKAESSPRQEPARDTDRTDDGSVALALLEGRIPPSSGSGQSGAAQQMGSFVLQVAAYSTQADAGTRRTALVDAGVTNAYIEEAVSNNRPTWRLRVGPFPTRDAAQAAQARLRALGYDNSLLLTQ